MDSEDWLQESHRLAKELAYDGLIMDRVRMAEGSRDRRLRMIRLPTSYYDAAGPAARKRASEAGHRLAKAVETQLP